MRTCYRFHFEPPGGYRLNVCMQDPKTIGVVTTDQLLALQYFERAFRPRDCFSAVPERGMNDYVVRIGKDAKVVNLQFANDASQPTAFCGCSDPEIRAIAVVMGAKLK